MPKEERYIASQGTVGDGGGSFACVKHVRRTVCFCGENLEAIVILSAAKNLFLRTERFFAALRMTGAARICARPCISVESRHSLPIKTPHRQHFHCHAQ